MCGCNPVALGSLAGGCVQHGTLTRCSTHAFAEVTLIRQSPPRTISGLFGLFFGGGGRVPTDKFSGEGQRALALYATEAAFVLCGELVKERCPVFVGVTHWAQTVEGCFATHCKHWSYYVTTLLRTPVHTNSSAQ